MGSHSLFQGTVPIQGLNTGLLHCRQILYHLSHQGSPSTALYLLKVEHGTVERTLPVIELWIHVFL